VPGEVSGKIRNVRAVIATPTKQSLCHEVVKSCEEREGFEPSVRSIFCGVRARVSPSASI